MFKWLKNLFSSEPKRFFVSDLHFGHDAVRGYCSRPWSTKEEMNEALIKIWNKQVKKNDIVFVLGDFSLSPRYVEECGARLNGRKFLVPGNHDKCFNPDKNPKAAKLLARYEKVFTVLPQQSWNRLKNGTDVMLCHFPYRSEAGGKYDQRYWNERPKDFGGWLIHGHLHCKYKKYGKMIDVGIDDNFKLTSEDELIKLMDDPRDFIPSRITEFYKQRNTHDDSY